jgi:hypothetical protein
LHPYSTAAYLVKGGVIFDQQYNNIFYRLTKKIDRDKYEIHYISEKQKSYFSVDAAAESIDLEIKGMDRFLNDFNKSNYPRLNKFKD